MFCDEMRYGLISNHRRGWSKSGKQRPLIPYGMEYEFGYIYIGINIETWELESLLLPEADSITTKVFIDYLREEYGNVPKIVGIKKEGGETFKIDIGKELKRRFRP